MSPDEHTTHRLDLAYARISTTKRGLERQFDTVTIAGIPAERIFAGKSISTTWTTK